MHRLSPQQRHHARDLRSNPTDAERALWSRLRGEQMHGARWRRQHAIGAYIADFACVAARMVVEVDGGQHAGSAQDQRRDAWMRAQGWRILRFWNHEVLNNMEGVLQVIADALASPPPPPSPWQGEGENAPATPAPVQEEGKNAPSAPAPGQGAGGGGGRT